HRGPVGRLGHDRGSLRAARAHVLDRREEPGLLAHDRGQVQGSRRYPGVLMGDRSEMAVIEGRALTPARDRSWVQDLLADWLATKAKSTLAAYRSDFSDFAQFITGDPTDHAGALAQLFELGEADAHRRALAYKADMMSRPVWRSSKARSNGEEP